VPDSTGLAKGVGFPCATGGFGGSPGRFVLPRSPVAADVDHLNTDDLAGLRAFLLAEDPQQQDKRRPHRQDAVA
jgi:hypothetical protein